MKSFSKPALNTVSISEEFAAVEGLEFRSYTIPRDKLDKTKDLEIRLRATLVGRTEATRDEAYFRQVRKQSFSTIQLLLQQMENARVSLDSYVPELLEEVDFALEQLADSAKAKKWEGNAMELLRMLRDSLKDAGWTSYRNRSVLRGVRLAITETAFGPSVETSHIGNMRARFKELGLTSCLVLQQLKSQLGSI